MISIVVSWRDRSELGRSISSLSETARQTGGDLTIVNFGGNAELLSQLVRPHLTLTNIVNVADQPFFNKARAQNIGASNTRYPVLFFCDCDILLQPELIESMARELMERPGTFATLAGVVESERNARRAGNLVCFGYELRLRIANGRELRIVDNEEDAADGTRQAPGLLLVRRSDFTSVNGYNGRLHGWGWEDQDMIARLTLSAGLTRIQRGTVTHLSHNDEARTAHYPPVRDRWESRDRMFRQALAAYDKGDFSGTLSEDSAAYGSMP